MAAGGAATGLPVLQFFEDIGVPIMEGYGLTETSPMISAGSCFLRATFTAGSLMYRLQRSALVCEPPTS
jgi:long-subunit acyl-CoA synthetase (AMP-forming)